MLATALLSACGGGGDGVDVASGQNTDPVVVDYPIAYVKRPIVLDDDGTPAQADARELRVFDIGADLYLRDRASPSAPERNLTEEITEGLGDVRDVEISWDGDKVLFAMRAQFIEGADEEDQPTWNIWEYSIPDGALRRVISSDIVAESGQDRFPHYLPDGRIVFSSTRQRQSGAILLDEGKPQFAALDGDRNEEAFVLHVMNEDGSDIHQVSFSQSHDLEPVVMDNGQIVFSRWERVAGINAISLYRMNPDGSDLELLYGYNSHNTGSEGDTIQFLRPREMDDGRVLAIAAPFSGTDDSGQIVAIDIANYVENLQTVVAGVAGASAQTPLTVNDVSTVPGLSTGGRFAAAFPLFDGTGRFFVSWSQCRLREDLPVVAPDPDDDDAVVEPPVIFPCTDTNLADPALIAADPAFGIWIYDPADDSQLPILPPEDGWRFDDVVAAQPRSRPVVILDRVAGGQLNAELVAENAGVIDIRSVYDIDGVDTIGIRPLADPSRASAADRPARFLRVVKAVSIPDDEVLEFENTAFGRSAANGMREIVAYAPIEPDGSVVLKVPADVALGVSVVDANGQRISARHQNWLQVRAGDRLSCNGCHVPGQGVSHGRSDAFDSAWSGYQGVAGSAFPATVSSLYAELGETMAQVRERISCFDNCESTEPSVDVVYDDVWTDPSVRTPDASLAYRYEDLQTAVPTSVACLDDWSAACRIVIHYPEHIQPLWELERPVLDAADVEIANNRCTSCHGVTDELGQTQVPAGQLSLEGTPSTDEPDHLTSYRELLFADNEQELDMGALQDVLVEVGTDPDTGEPIFVTVGVAPVMNVAGALSSGQFFDRFRDAGDAHYQMLSPAELRLVAEWLDIGGQYYNDPFDSVPE